MPEVAGWHLVFPATMARGASVEQIRSDVFALRPIAFWTGDDGAQLRVFMDANTAIVHISQPLQYSLTVCVVGNAAILVTIELVTFPTVFDSCHGASRCFHCEDSITKLPTFGGTLYRVFVGPHD